MKQLSRPPPADAPLGDTPEPECTREELWSELREASVLRFGQDVEDLESTASKVGQPRVRSWVQALSAWLQGSWHATVYRYLKFREVWWSTLLPKIIPFAAAPQGASAFFQPDNHGSMI